MRQKIYNELKQAFPTKQDLTDAWQLDVQRGADGETPLGYLLDYARDLGYIKAESWLVCEQLIEEYKLNNLAI